MKSEVVYPVVAYRFGDKERHSYIVGIFTDDRKAVSEALAEEEFRGGKYECAIYKIPLDTSVQMNGWETIKEVPPSPHEEHEKYFAITKEITRLKLLLNSFSEYPELQKAIKSLEKELQKTRETLK